jgi:hypothetical protein
LGRGRTPGWTASITTCWLMCWNIDLYRRALLEQVALQEFEMQGEVGRNMGRDVARTARDTIRQMNTQIE